MGLNQHIHAQAERDRHDAETQRSRHQAINEDMKRQVAETRARLAARDAERAAARRRLED